MPHADPPPKGEPMTQDRRQTTYDANAEFWIEIIQNHRDKYREELTNTAVLDAIGAAEGLAVLDAGCGEGYLSRKLAREGAIVTGVDSSAELIKAALSHELAVQEPACFFFFQAEDGIRDADVTGVQKCALPICPTASWRRSVSKSTVTVSCGG